MIQSDFCFGSRPKFLSAQSSPNCNRCISMLRDRDRCDDSISEQDPTSIQEPIHRELVAEDVHGGVEEKTACGRRQQLQRRECFQIQAASYPKPCSRLISPQGKFHCWPIESVNLFVIEATTGQRDLSRKHHIALHGGRSGLEWGAGKSPSSG